MHFPLISPLSMHQISSNLQDPRDADLAARNKNPMAAMTPAITNALVPSRQCGGHVAGCRASPARVSVYEDGPNQACLCLPQIIPRLESSSVPFCSENDRSVLLGT